MSAPDPPPAIVLDRAGLGRLVEVLIAEGYRVIGPTVRDNAIVLGRAGLGRPSCPRAGGWKPAPATTGCAAGTTRPSSRIRPARSPGSSSCTRRGASSGPRTARTGSGRPNRDSPRYAFLGVRGCDLAAIGILGSVLGGGAHPDGAFARTRRGLFVIAVELHRARRGVLLRVDGHRPGRRARLRHRAHRANRRARALLRGRGRHRRGRAHPGRDPAPRPTARGSSTSRRAEVAEAAHADGPADAGRWTCPRCSGTLASHRTGRTWPAGA